MSTTFRRPRWSVAPSLPRDNGYDLDVDKDIVDAPIASVTAPTASIRIPAFAAGIRFPAWARAAELRLQATTAPEAQRISEVFESQLHHPELLRKFAALKTTGNNALQIVKLMKVDTALAEFQTKMHRRPNWARLDPNKDTIRAHSIVLKNEAEHVGAGGRAQQLAVLKKETEP